MTVINGVTQNKYFDPSNPRSKKFKVNNIQAILTIREIMEYDGELDHPDFTEIYKKFINEERVTYTEMANAELLGKKIGQFYRAWSKIREDKELVNSLKKTLDIILDDPIKFKDCYDKYKQEGVPVCFNMGSYLSNILDDNGKVISPNTPALKQVHKDYQDLANDFMNGFAKKLENNTDVEAE